MKRLGLLTLAHFLLLAAPCFAQETNTSHEFDASLDVYTQHLWRGFSNGTSVSLQPAVEYNFNCFTAGAWGAWCIDGSYTELDLFVAYKKGAFSATLYDYFCPVNPVEKFEFFEITQGQTKHTFDLNLEYADPARHPFSMLIATMLYGDDLNPENGKNYYSTYIEPAANFSIGKTDFKAFAGFTPAKSYYAGKAAFTNIGISASHMVKISKKFSLPLKAIVVHNPDKQRTYFSLGVNF